MADFADFKAYAKSQTKIFELALRKTIDSGFLVGGPLVEDFERDFSAFIGVENCVGVGNGLDAIRLILEGWGIGPGDEVIVPAFTFYASWLAVVQTGATLVPVDVNPSDATINPLLIEERVTKKTKAILVVHLYGNPVDMAPVLEIATRLGLKVLEDAAQSHGARFRGERVGGLGDAAAFSFYPTKNLGAFGDGGAVTTNDPGLAKVVRSKRTYGNSVDKFTFDFLGTNSRLDALQAAYLALRLPKLEEENSRRSQIFQRYRDALQTPSAWVVTNNSSATPVHHLAVLQVPDRPSVLSALSEYNIGYDLHYPYWVGSIPLMASHLDEQFDGGAFPVARSLAESVVSVPLGPWVSEDEAERVCCLLSNMKGSV